MPPAARERMGTSLDRAETSGRSEGLDGRSKALAQTYSAIAEWLLYPEEIDPDTLTPEAVAAALVAARAVDPAVGEQLAAFDARRGEVTLEGYLELLELNPRCPLYLGTYQFDEPKSCAAAGFSDRNTYMLEVGNIYRHFGFELRGELPDFLPAMVEFLALSAACDGSDRAVRLRFIEKLTIQGVRPFAERLKKEGSPYHHLAEALLLCLEIELETDGSHAESAPAPVGRALPVIDSKGLMTEGETIFHG